LQKGEDRLSKRLARKARLSPAPLAIPKSPNDNGADDSAVVASRAPRRRDGGAMSHCAFVTPRLAGFRMATDPRIRIGMFRNGSPPGAVALAAAHAAVVQGAQFFFFAPDDVDLAERTINAQFFENSEWTRRITEFPHVVDNDIYPTNSDIWKTLVKSARIMTPPLGGKLGVDRRMRKVKAFEPILIPTVPLISFEDLRTQIEIHREVVVKPDYGSGGADLTFIGRRPGGYKANFSLKNWRLDEEGLHRLYQNRMRAKKYILQKYIASRTLDGRPFDIRLHVRRDRSAEWRLIKVWARIGSGKGVVSNVAAGGGITNGRQFLKNRFGEAGERIYRQMIALSNNFPTRFQALYDDRTLDALGIDLGLDSDGNPWLFEVNTYPGADYCEIQDAVARIGYAIFLAENPDYRDGVVRTPPSEFI
jgi:hypothetical protein